MSVSAADIAEVRRLGEIPPDHEAIDMTALQSIEEVIGYVIAAARVEGDNETDQVELVVRAVDLTADTVRDVERTLRRLGYRDVCTRLRQIAGRRKRDLAPLR
jgi:predicted hydrolase (HD superfamily)